MGKSLKPEFNRISFAGRCKLKTVAAITALSGFVREDTKKHPSRFPFYAVYMIVIATPLPVLGAGVTLLGATVLWTKMEMTPYTKRLNKAFKDAFNEVALVDAHGDHINPDGKKPGYFTVDNKALVKDTAKKVYEDTRQSGRYAWSALKNVFK